MKGCTRIILIVAIFFASYAGAQVPVLPNGASSHWVVNQPEEVVGYVLFDPATVNDRLPSRLRFITIGELANAGVSWANDHLAEMPSHKLWGVSFFEIVRTGTFMIDGLAPSWPQDGAMALWAARVAPSDLSDDLNMPGQALLVLEYWFPDGQYVTYMHEKGYYATYGSVELSQDVNGSWLGLVKVDGLSVAARCTPAGPVTGGAGSRGMQTLIPPKTAEVTSYVTVAFAGHQIQECREGNSWEIEGTHALSKGVPLGPSTFQFGYELEGGVFE